MLVILISKLFWRALSAVSELNAFLVTSQPRPGSAEWKENAEVSHGPRCPSCKQGIVDKL